MDEVAQVIAEQLRQLMGVLIGPTNLASTSTSKSLEDITLYSLIEQARICTVWFIKSVFEEANGSQFTVRAKCMDYYCKFLLTIISYSITHVSLL